MCLQIFLQDKCVFEELQFTLPDNAPFSTMTWCTEFKCNDALKYRSYLGGHNHGRYARKSKKIVKSWKDMACVIIIIERNRETITTEYYALLIVKLRKKQNNKRRGKLRALRVLFIITMPTVRRSCCKYYHPNFGFQRCSTHHILPN